MNVVALAKRVNPRSRATISFIGAALYVYVLLLTWLAMPGKSDPAACGLSFLIATLGGLVGGAIGALISPSESGEKETFKAVLGIASAVLTGVIWKSFDTQLHSFFVNDLPQSSLVQVRFYCFSVAVFLGAFVMFAYRAYGRPPDMEKLRKSIEDIRTSLTALEQNAAPAKSDA